MSTQLPKVVVVGGGFAGAYAARALLRRTRGAVDVTIVNSTNYMLFTPLLPEAASGAIEPRHVVVPLRHMLPGARVVTGTVTSVAAADQSVQVRLPAGDTRTLTYDRLIFAPGGAPRYIPIPGLAQRAVGVKTLAEGIWLRNRAIDMLERADIEPDSGTRRTMLSFVFVGGGYAGVEFLAELHSFVRRALRYYPNIDRSELSWTLVDAAPGILREMGGDLGSYAAERLTRRGINVLCNAQIERVDDTTITLASGEARPCGTLVWAAGVAPSPLVATLGAETAPGGRLVVDAEMRVPSMPHVWSLGDCAAVPNAADNNAICPPTSQHALRQARQVGRNVAASLGYGRAAAFSYGSRGGLATLGVGDGVANIMGIRFRGVLAWFAARTYHLIAIPTVSRRFRIALDWTVQLVTPYDVVQLGQLGHPPRIDGSSDT